MTNLKHATEGLNSSIYNQIKELLYNYNRIVLVQVHELERLKIKRTISSQEIVYVKSLFQHYIIDNKQKTYLC